MRAGAGRCAAPRSSPAVARARDDERAVDRIALLVLHAGHEPRRVRVLRVHGHREAEARRPAPLAISSQVLPPSVLRRCRCGVGSRGGPVRSRHCTILCGSWNFGSNALLGRHVRGAHAATVDTAHVAPASLLDPDAAARDADPHDVRDRAGSTQIEWMPGKSAPPPNQALRSGWFQSESTKLPRVAAVASSGTARRGSCRTRARRRVRRIPRAPRRASGPTARASRRVGSMSSSPSGFGGYFGTGRSSHVAPPSRERFSLTPKWPRSCAAMHACRRPRRRTIVTGSPSSSAPLDSPLGALPPSTKSPFPRADEELCGHDQPPERAWKDIDLTLRAEASLKALRSRRLRPSTSTFMCLRTSP